MKHRTRWNSQKCNRIDLPSKQTTDPPRRADHRHFSPLAGPTPINPTHYEPEQEFAFRHEIGPAPLSDEKAPGARLCPGGGRPIVARLRRADGRRYGRPSTFVLRSPATWNLVFLRNSPGRLSAFSDIPRVQHQQSPTPTFFTERTLAAHLAVSDRTIRNWIRRGELPSYKLGAARRIDPADVDDFLASRRDEGT